MRMMMMMMIFFFLLLGAIMGEKPLVELYTRDELTNLAGYGEQKLSTVVVTGTLLCDSFSDSSQIHSQPIPGASVVVGCRGNKKTISKMRGKSDEYGDFVIDLPSHLHAIPNMEKRCIVRVVQVPKKSGCACSLIKHKGALAAGIKLKLLSSGNGIRTYTTTHAHGGIHFKQHSYPLTKINTRNKNTRSSGRKMLQ